VRVPVQTVRTENSVCGALHLKVSPNDDTAVKSSSSDSDEGLACVVLPI
jgi:hypothetical protein